MKCLFGHRWHEVARKEYVDTSWGGRVYMTEFYWTCARCGKRKTTDLKGLWGQL